MKLKRQRLIPQSTLARMLQTAEEAWKRKEFQQSIGIMERACRLDPANSGLLLDLGRAYGVRYDYAAAESCFEKAIRFAPKKTESLAIAGQLSRDFGNYEMAERYFQRAAEQKDVPPETLVKLAELYERLRRLEDADTLIDRALHLNGACPAALLARARLERQAGRLEGAERLLRTFLAKPDPTWRVPAWYELGGVLDRQGRYDDAMAAFLEAKAILRPDTAPHTTTLHIIRARLKELASNASSDVLQRWFDSGKALQPPHRLALLGGHPRSGTTLLEQVLDSHPDVVSSEERDIFQDDAYAPLTHSRPQDPSMLAILESATIEMLQKSRENYFHITALFLGSPIGDRLLIDKNPTFTFFIPAFIRIFPEIKFLVALRDPRDVCLSCFMQPLPLNQAAAAFLSLEGTVEEYTSLMDIWRTVAPRMQNPHLEVRYEDMVEDLESVARRVLNFLDVPWDARVLGFDAHARQKLVRSPTYADVTKPVFKTAVGRWRNYERHLEPYLEKLAPFVKAFGYE